jgi:hypothetical protein
MIRHLELKSGYHDDGPAWIALVLVSKSGRTVYFNGKALKRSTQGVSGNYYDVETAESYWVSGVKKKGGDRHWAGRGKITIDAGAIDEYLRIIGAKELDPSRFVVSAAIKPPDAKKFPRAGESATDAARWLSLINLRQGAMLRSARAVPASRPASRTSACGLRSLVALEPRAERLPWSSTI